MNVHVVNHTHVLYDFNVATCPHCRLENMHNPKRNEWRDTCRHVIKVNKHGQFVFTGRY